MDETGYELSASYMNGLVKSVREAGFLEAILVGLPADQRAAFTRPALAPWWDAGFAEQLVLAVFKQFGERAVEQVGYGVVAETMGPLVMPQLQTLMQSGGGDPAAIFSRMEGVIASAVRPVTAKWIAAGPKEGTLSLQYPKPIRRGIAFLWRGAVRYVFEITRSSSGKIVTEALDEQSGNLRFAVSWS